MLGGLGEHLPWRANCSEVAVFECNNVVCELGYVVHVVRDDKDGPAIMLELCD